MEFGLIPFDPEFQDLDASAVSCVATVHMRDAQLRSITLTVSSSYDSDPAPMDKLDKHQACFDKVHRQFVRRGETELDQKKFERFKAEYKACAD